MSTWRSLALLLTLTTACAPDSAEEFSEGPWNSNPVPAPLTSRKKPCTPGASLLADIRPGTVGSRPRELVIVGGELFFTAEDGSTGRELWKSSGSHGGGTVRVKDVRPGAGTSNPRRLTEVDGKLFFTAEDGQHGRELWVSDGTPQGTVMVKDIFPGPFGSAPDHLVAFEGILYFAANDGVHGTELWRSDGTLDGTFLVEDLFPGEDASQPGRPNSSSPRRLIQTGNALYFVAQQGSTQHLWRSTGEPGAASVFSAPLSTFMFSFTSVGPELFFLVDEGSGVANLWWTRNARSRLLRTFPGQYPHDLVAVGKRLFFSAGDTDGEELWTSDGTVGGTEKVKDLRSGPPSSSPTGLVELDRQVFFAAEDGSRGRELWRSDGSARDTVLVRDVQTGVGSSAPEQLTAILGTLFFSAETTGHGRELWMSDGTAAGTGPVADIAPGDASSNPSGFVRSGAEVYFIATTPASGEELWVLPLHAGSRCRGFVSE
ncbi:MAG TPA: ELWxxDGT repeat protein [Myxococcaceae bacterium]|jgi:ELWxxDGT repeat protein